MQKSSVITLLILALIIAVVGFIAFSPSKTNNDALTEAGRALSGLNDQGFTDLNGNPVSLEQFQGQVRVVNSWASWCPFCVQELPDFEELAEEYAADEVVVIAINRKETIQRATGFLSTLGDLDTMLFVQDPADNFYQSIGGFSMPETIFYDRSGNVVVHKRGFMSLEEMRTHTEAALASDQYE